LTFGTANDVVGIDAEYCTVAVSPLVIPPDDTTAMRSMPPPARALTAHIAIDAAPPTTAANVLTRLSIRRNASTLNSPISLTSAATGGVVQPLRNKENSNSLNRYETRSEDATGHPIKRIIKNVVLN
jgi:hypothetical protein